MLYITGTEYSNIQKKLEDRKNLLEACRDLTALWRYYHSNIGNMSVTKRYEKAQQAIAKAERWE